MQKQIVSNKEECIQWYLDRGYILFPLVGKIPPKNCHWRQIQYDPFFEAEANFGVQLGSTDLVVDIDPRNGGEESFKKLGSNFSTFTVQTGSGGLHIYLKKPAGSKIRKNLREFPGIDFITEGGYVVGSGSIHPITGQPYIIRENGKIEDAPPELLEILQKQEIELTKGTGQYDDNIQNEQRFIEYLKDSPRAIQGQAGDSTTFTVAATGRDYGLSPDRCWGLLLEFYNPHCQPPWKEDELKNKVSNVYRYAKGSIGSKAPAVAFEVWTEEQIEKENKEINKYLQRRGGFIKANLNNTVILFNENFPVPTLHHLLGFNEFTNNIEFLRAAPWHKPNRPALAWSDEEAVLCKYFMSNLWKFEPPTALVHEAALKASKDHCFHPVRDYLNGLKWDGHSRCNVWLHQIMGAADNKYTRAVGLKFLVAAVKRIFEPGCKFDYLLTLEGRQGTFKSTVFEILATRKAWYCDPHLDITNKDAVVSMFGKWIVEMPEMQTHFRAETTAMKGFLSRSVDRVRMPYARCSTDFPRQCVFGGTINHESDRDLGWLKDTTGNRRYWPVFIGEVAQPDLSGLKAVVDQIWAEAYLLYKQGVAVYLEDAALVKEAEDEQAKRLGKDPWQDHIEAWLGAPQNLITNIFSGDTIFRDCVGGGLDKYTNREMARIGKVMEVLGWVKGVYWSKEAQKATRGYKRPELL